MNKTSSFNKDGYSNWKNAKGAESGFKSHENEEHNKAMKLWDDLNNRYKSSSTIIHKIANKPEHRQWLEAVFLMSKALVKNGQPLLGHEEFTDFEEGVSGGLYLNFMNDLVEARSCRKLQKNNRKTRNTERSHQCSEGYRGK